MTCPLVITQPLLGITSTEIRDGESTLVEKRARRTEFRVMICLGNEYIRERGIFQTRWVNQHLKSVDTTVAYLESDNLWKESRLGLEKTVIRQITSQQMPDSTPNQC